MPSASGQLEARREIVDANPGAAPNRLVGGDAREHRPGSGALIRGSTERVRAVARREEIREQTLLLLGGAGAWKVGGNYLILLEVDGNYLILLGDLP